MSNCRGVSVRRCDMSSSMLVTCLVVGLPVALVVTCSPSGSTPPRTCWTPGCRRPTPRGSWPAGSAVRPGRRTLLRVFYLAANNSIKTCPKSRNYYDRKRSEGKRHSQAVLCLARRGLNVLWAMQRDNTSYQPGLPRAA